MTQDTVAADVRRIFLRHLGLPNAGAWTDSQDHWIDYAFAKRGGPAVRVLMVCDLEEHFGCWLGSSYGDWGRVEDAERSVRRALNEPV